MPIKPTGVRKLCATRWLARTPALRDVLHAYDAIQVAFKEFSQSSRTVQGSSNFGGIASSLNKSLTYVGIHICLLVFRKAEITPLILQQRGSRLQTAMDSVRELRQFYVELRKDDKWNQISDESTQKAIELDLKVPHLPHARCPPKKLEQTQSATITHQFQNIKVKYKANYFELLDVLVNELDQRFDQPGMDNLLRIERIVTGDFEPDDIDNVL